MSAPRALPDLDAAAKVTVRREIAAPAEKVFDAWLDPASFAAWMESGDGARRVTVINRPHRLVFTWCPPAGGHAKSLVTVEFHAGQQSTEVIVTHELLPG